MTKHCKVYFDYFGYGIDSYVPCEMCGKRAVDIHHVNGRGKNRDVISNLMALCRDHHRRAHTDINKAVMQARHDEFLENKS